MKHVKIFEAFSSLRKDLSDVGISDSNINLEYYQNFFNTKKFIEEAEDTIYSFSGKNGRKISRIHGWLGGPVWLADADTKMKSKLYIFFNDDSENFAYVTFMTYATGYEFEMDEPFNLEISKVPNEHFSEFRDFSPPKIYTGYPKYKFVKTEDFMSEYKKNNNFMLTLLNSVDRTFLAR